MAKTKIINLNFIKKNIHFIVLYILIFALALVLVLEIKKLKDMNYELKNELSNNSSLYSKMEDNYRRFSIYLHPSFREDQYLLDTKLGRVWLRVQDSKTKIDSWQELDVENNESSIIGRLEKMIEVNQEQEREKGKFNIDEYRKQYRKQLRENK